jgi:hypothetical protein
MKYDRDPLTTLPARTTLAVTSPRSPGPSGLHARRHIIPRFAKSSNALVEKSVRSAWQVLIVNSLAVARSGTVPHKAATTTRAAAVVRTAWLEFMTGEGREDELSSPRELAIERITAAIPNQSGLVIYRQNLAKSEK